MLIFLHDARPREAAPARIRGRTQPKRIVGLAVPIHLVVAAAVPWLGVVADLQQESSSTRPLDKTWVQTCSPDTGVMAVKSMAVQAALGVWFGAWCRAGVCVERSDPWVPLNPCSC